MQYLTIILLSIIVIYLIIQNIFFYLRYKSVVYALYKITNDMNTLYNNQNRIIELSGIKSVVELIDHETGNIKKEIETEKYKEKLGAFRSSKSN